MWKICIDFLQVLDHLEQFGGVLLLLIKFIIWMEKAMILFIFILPLPSSEITFKQCPISIILLLSKKGVYFNKF